MFAGEQVNIQRNFETDAAAVAVPDVTSLTAQLPCPSQCQRSELLRSARPGQLGPSRLQQCPRSDDSSDPLVNANSVLKCVYLLECL